MSPRRKTPFCSLSITLPLPQVASSVRKSLQLLRLSRTSARRLPHRLHQDTPPACKNPYTFCVSGELTVQQSPDLRRPFVLYSFVAEESSKSDYIICSPLPWRVKYLSLYLRTGSLRAIWANGSCRWTRGGRYLLARPLPHIRLSLCTIVVSWALCIWALFFFIKV